MYDLGKKLFSRAALPADEHCDIGGGYLSRDVNGPVEHRRNADDPEPLFYRQNIHVLKISYLSFQSGQMASAQRLDLTAEFKIATDLLIGEDPECINNSNRTTGPLHDIIGVQIQVMGMRHSEDQGLDPFQCLFKGFLHHGVFQVLLVPEKPFP